ncbi:MAG: deoxyribose-phosphate aldolase [Oscillospiraceae bacterium]|nr:deoxyribose-phosphate aldolase [Oscillospiraceae bacterium]
MDIKDILSKVDHTLLSPTATWEEIKIICDDAMKYETASVCVPPSFVSLCAEYLGGKIPVCTVIGFPNGYNTTEIKCLEAEAAINDGADEIDMVINQGFVKSGEYDLVLNEINKVKNVCGDKVLKVIVETCNLDFEEKVEISEVVAKSDADFIKTSTGFGKSGATFEDIEIFAANIHNNTKIKAAGGITSIEDAEKFIALGADRLGTSRIVKLVKEQGLL